jgi:hypothetical protein
MWLMVLLTVGLFAERDRACLARGRRPKDSGNLRGRSETDLGD